MRGFNVYRVLQIIGVTAAVSVFGFAGCAAESTDSEPVHEEGPAKALVGSQDDGEPVPPPVQQCVTIKRGGAGNVTDAFLAGDYTGYNSGPELNLYSGISSAGNVNKVIVGFDLSPIPASATIVSATFSMYKSWSADNATIDIHRVKAAWNENTVTRENFGGSDEVAVAAFSGSGVGQKTADITSLVQAWREGVYPNYGITLEEAPIAAHHYFSSEAGAAYAPSLTVCYNPATCDDGIKNQGEAGVDCGGPCAACPTCNDNIQNQGETGVDCGGPCVACATCSDGIKNGTETGVDCGGSCAAVCSISMVGSFNINSGPAYAGNPASYTCTEACALIYGGTANQYGCSTVAGTMNNLAWVDGWGDSSHCPGGVPVADTYEKPVNGNYNCGSTGCSYSAYVSDHGCTGPNYCWKTSGTLSSCKAIKQANPAATSGTYTIDPDGAGAIGAQTVYCDMTTDGGGYTMKRINDAALGGNQDTYASKCASVGMEVIVPRTKAHMQAIYNWNGDWPNLVNVFPNYNGAAGLNNWHGSCKGQTCGFYISGNNNAWCNGSEPNGDNNVNYRIYRWSGACGIDNGSGGWNDANNTVNITGWVLCSTNDK